MKGNLPNSSSHFWKRKSVFLQVLHQPSMSSNITPLYFFSLNIIYFDRKEPINAQILKTLEYSSQNLTNSSCQFRKDKSVISSILHHSLFPWDITPLQILSSQIFYFGEMNPIKAPILRLSCALLKIFQIPHVIFKPQVSFASNFALIFSAIKDIFSVLS